MITTHVLDTARGRPAEGMTVLLEMRLASEWSPIARGMTDEHGRLAGLTEGRSMTPGTYCLTFDTATYHRHHGVTTPFFPEVKVTFCVRDVDEHYHVPLLLSPFGYSTYIEDHESSASSTARCPMSQLIWNRYGKSRIRLVKIRRPPAPAPHAVVDLSLDIQLEGAFDAVYIDGDNSGCLPTDTMKNTVYAFARHDPIDQVEAFGIRLAEHFAAEPLVSRVRIAVTEHRWDQLATDGRLDPHAFVQPGGEQWTAVITRDATGCDVTAGLTNLVVLKTTSSAFAGFPRDEFTMLPDTRDRLLATSITASWTYRQGVRDFSVRDQVRAALVEAFAGHASESVQHTLYAMGAAALAACADLLEITLTMPNRHHLLVDLSSFGLDNPNEVFVATDQPFGVIEATVRR